MRRKHAKETENQKKDNRKHKYWVTVPNIYFQISQTIKNGGKAGTMHFKDQKKMSPNVKIKRFFAENKEICKILGNV